MNMFEMGLIIYCIILTIVIFRINRKYKDYHRRIHNVEVECFSPVAEVIVNGKKANRLTLCGAVKPIFDVISHRNKKPKIIIPGIKI